jgi:hypothetical protein
MASRSFHTASAGLVNSGHAAIAKISIIAVCSLGSVRAVAALVTSGRFGKERRSLRRARTGRVRDGADNIPYNI